MLKLDKTEEKNDGKVGFHQQQRREAIMRTVTKNFNCTGVICV